MIGCNCTVCTSRDPRDKRLRSSALLTDGGKHFVIDTGPDFRTQMLRERVPHIEGVLITHEHNDHTAGIDDLRPFGFARGEDVPVYCLPRVARDLRARFAYAFGDYPGVPRLNIREVDFGDRIPFASGELELLEVTHGKLPILGFRWHDLAYLTDVKELPALTRVQCKGVKTALISSLRRSGTHSHLGLKESLAYLDEMQAGRGVLFHFSHRMGKAGELNAELPANVESGFDGMRIVASDAKLR